MGKRILSYISVHVDLTSFVLRCGKTYLLYDISGKFVHEYILRQERHMGASELFTGERFIPGAGDDKLGIEHYQRYLGVREMVRG